MEKQMETTIGLRVQDFGVATIKVKGKVLGPTLRIGSPSSIVDTQRSIYRL